VNPDNKDAVKSLRNICSGTVATIEAKLEAQKRSNGAEAIRLEAEEAKHKAKEERQQHEEQRRREDAKLAEVRARVEQARKMVEDQMDIEHIRRELEAKTQAFSDVQRAARIDVDDASNDDAGDDDRSDSAPEVHYLFFNSLYSLLITLDSSIRAPQKNKTHQKEEARKRMPQVTYKTVSNLWLQ
jgi:hypothetical protein